MSAARDDNRVPTLIAALNTDGTTIVAVLADPVLNALWVNDDTTGTDHGTPNAKRDDNRVPVLMGVSSADLVTPVEVYADSSGRLLVDGT